MKILISGASGLIGSALVKSFSEAGHEVTRLVRHQPHAAELRWDPTGGHLDRAELEGFDAVVHLAGENIARGRWTRRQKARIRDSRAVGTRLLSQTLAELADPPRVFASASAVGYYGNRGDEQLDEESPAGVGFLAEVCRDWEAATGPAAGASIRVVQLRLGMVLASHGGALAKMLPLFRLGLGGRLGNGRQYVSWITLDDVVGAVGHVLATGALRGPVNLVAPQPVTNRQLTAALGRVLKRPTFLPAPAVALRIMLGEMAEGLLLASARVVPKRLQDAGYQFRDPELEGALRRILDR
ncbi:MAG: TIGR01777 family oxidoreductase [Planctomycetota bacterium]|jgi:uncharacterized protein (TIGR01777 family)